MNWEGFLMGVSDFGLERLKEERQKKMLKELEELKETHKIAAEQRQEKLLARTVHRTEEDAEGRLQDYSVFGDPLNEAREQSPWVGEQRNMERDKHTDALETSASTRNYQSRSLDLKGQELAERRKAREAGVPELDTSEVGISDIMDFILEPYRNVPLAQQGQFRNLARKVAGRARNMPAEAGMTKLETASMLFDMEVTPLLGDESGSGKGRPEGEG